jgi:hypothetical protein
MMTTAASIAAAYSVHSVYGMMNLKQQQSEE